MDMISLHILFSLTISLNAQAAQTSRIDNSTVENFIPFVKRYELIIEENCAHCMSQINILKECAPHEDVIVLVNNPQNKTEEVLKKGLRKKKIPFKTYLLNDALKSSYAFKNVTPMIWINKKSYTGVVNCDLIKKEI